MRIHQVLRATLRPAAAASTGTVCIYPPLESREERIHGSTPGPTFRPGDARTSFYKLTKGLSSRSSSTGAARELIRVHLLKALRSRLSLCCRLRKRTSGDKTTRTKSQSTKRVELLLLLLQLG